MLEVSALTVIHAYHQLFNVEASFRIAKTDLKARPIYHWAREKVEAHLMVVFAAIAVSRWVQECTGVSIKGFVRLLAPARGGVVLVDGVEHHMPPSLTPEIEALVAKLA